MNAEKIARGRVRSILGKAGSPVRLYQITALSKLLVAARNEGLEDAAEYCARHMMATPTNPRRATHDHFTAMEFDGEDQSHHQGLGYAAAIRGLKK